MIQQGRLQGTTLTVSPRQSGLLIAGGCVDSRWRADVRVSGDDGSATYSSLADRWSV